MPRRPNPYIAGPPVSGPNFYGRENIFRFVQDTFSSPRQNVAVLYGQRRIGKTSVLHELPSRLSSEFHPIFFDLQNKAQQKLNEVLYDLAREIAGSLNLDFPSRDDFLGDDDYFHERFLPRAYQNLETKRLLLMFDEFDVLDMPEKELARDVAVRAFFPYLQRRLMHDGQVAFVFATGRRLDELDRLLKSIFKVAKAAHVSFLEETEARQLIVKSASEIFEYDEEAVGRITSITACHPYLTQLVCSKLFDYTEAARKTRVTADDVEAVIDGAIAAGEAGLAWLWDSLSPAERPVLSIVAHAAKGGHAATRDEIDRTLKDLRVQFSGLELTRAPDNLTKRELLRRTTDGYEFVVEFLQRWILSEHSLEQVWLDLESASPRAIQLYELAVKAHESDKLEEAIRLYERTLGANPNHVPARLGWAHALLERGRIEEAIIEYEEAYRLNELMARDGLIAARQKWAEALEKMGRVDEADQEYKTILGIAPHDHRLREWVANRWTTRGRRYLGEGHYKEAIAEYEKATALNVLGAREELIVARQTWAEALEREGKADEADQQYEVILRLAPGDDKLKECVANCLMARGQKCLEASGYEKAIVEYKKADTLGLSSARKGLIAARQAWAEALEREYKASEADQQYDAILGIAPDDVRVREWIANSLIGRGDKYLAEERYTEASQAYDRAQSIQPEKQQALVQHRHRLELAPVYDEAMKAHKAGEWGAAWERWTELYKKDPDYRGRDGKGKRVAELLKEAIDEREKAALQMAKREKAAERRRKLLRLLGGLAVIFIGLAIGLRLGPWSVWPSETPTAMVMPTSTRIAIAMPTATPTVTGTPEAPPTAPTPPTVTPTATDTHTATPTVTDTPALPTATDTPTATPTATDTPTATPLPTPLGPRSILDVDVDPNNNKIMYVVAKGEGIYKTTDSGYRWQLTKPYTQTYSLTLGEADSQNVYVAIEGGILKSTDGGASWRSPIEIRSQRTDQAPKGAVHVLAVAPDNDQIVYAGTDGGVYRSEDGGLTWETRNGGTDGNPIYTLVVASDDGQLLYAAGKGAEIWRTLDGGNFWDKLPCSGGMQEVYALALHPTPDCRKNRLYIGTNNSTVAVSVDGGCNWRPIMLGEEKPLYLRAQLKISAVTILAFRDSETVLLAATGDRDNLSGNGIYKSTDGGLSWRPVNNGLPPDSSGACAVHSIAVDPQNNQTVYAGTFYGLYKSTDSGESWARIP